ncbi:MAG TPA: DUF3828 domain-containing protein [Candidatus Acidoferrales bacterium]|nr:DUF3828 domain-containing protein [Candidatus Acidoferrales bacterium]
MSVALRRSLLASVVVLLTGPAFGAQAARQPSSKPADAVRAFYTFHFAHDMAFTEASVRAKAAWLAPELFELCVAYFKKPVPAGQVPDIDGDPFTDSQEYPKSFRVGQPRVSATTVRVPVVLSWPGQQRTIRVQLQAVDGSWRITNITYGGLRSLRVLLSSGS